MCDYSLEMYGSRPAREGELYVTTRFPSGSIGFAAPGAPRTPVCVQCDTTVVLTDIPSVMQKNLGIGSEVETVFAQRDSGLYRDGLRLKTAGSCRCRICRPASAPISRACSSAGSRRGSRRPSRGAFALPATVD